MRTKFKTRQFKAWAILSLLVLIVTLIVIRLIVIDQSNNEKMLLEAELKRFEGEVQSTLLTYESFSNYIFDRIEQEEEIISIIDQANTASIQEKEILRNQLYDKLYDKYLDMTKYEFRQLHFHLPNTESFLRVHTPEKYGDILEDVRESVRLVNKNKVKVTGFEEGKIYNGFRYVYPLTYNNDHIGSVEVSISSASIIEVLSKLYPKEKFSFIIDKSVVEDNLFEEEIINYEDSPIFEDFYTDREVNQVIKKYDAVISESEELFYGDSIEDYNKRLKEKESFSVIQKFEGKDYSINFLAVKNIKDDTIAYLISVSEASQYRRFTEEMYKEVILIVILAVIIIGFGLILTFYQLRLKNSAEIDYLTKIYNRNKFYEIVDREIRRSKYYKEKSFVMLIDIDHFKKVNDTYGHDWGDKVLRELAREISQNIRKNDVFARWGGEEFVLLLPNIEKNTAIEKAESIRALIDQAQSKELKGITISIGVSSIDSDNYDIDSSIKLADQAMYCAKESGRNRVCYK